MREHWKVKYRQYKGDMEGVRDGVLSWKNKDDNEWTPYTPKELTRIIFDEKHDHLNTVSDLQEVVFNQLWKSHMKPIWGEDEIRLTLEDEKWKGNWGNKCSD